MRSPLATALRDLLPDDRTTIRTIAWWRAHGRTYQPVNEATARHLVRIMMGAEGVCP